jgi:hypothetical protein
MVQPLHGPNDIGVRVAPRSGRQSVLRPSRLAVHIEDTTEDCWRCDVIAAVAGAGVTPS